MKIKEKVIQQVLDGFQRLKGRASFYCFTKEIIPDIVFNVILLFRNICLYWDFLKQYLYGLIAVLNTARKIPRLNHGFSSSFFVIFFHSNCLKD